MSTFKVGESSSHWIAYQFIAGFGLGTGMQSSGLAAQAVLPKPDVPTGISIMFFAQQLGGAIFTSVGQNLLSNLLISQLSDIPGLDPSSIVGGGATDLVSLVPAEFRDRVLEAYNYAITRILLCGMGVALVGTIAALFMEWKNIKHTGPPKPPSSAATSGARATSAPQRPSIQSVRQSAESSVGPARLVKRRRPSVQSARQSVELPVRPAPVEKRRRSSVRSARRSTESSVRPAPVETRRRSSVHSARRSAESSVRPARLEKRRRPSSASTSQVG
jgi:hypothetical protein